MVRFCSLAAPLLMLSTAALAQTPPPSTGSGGPGQPLISPRNGQTSEQLGRDRYECYTWAKAQTGVDPSLGQATSGPTGLDSYRRAFSACLDGRGYNVSYGAPLSAPPAPSAYPPPPAMRATRAYVYTGPELKYHPLQFSAEGGYTIAAGSTGDDLDDGSSGGVGLTYFPTSSLPLGIRVDGSYSRFDARHQFLNETGFNRGHEDIYGGDADLQLDLANHSSRYKFYVFGGAGWYRESLHLHEVSYSDFGGCGFYGCGPGVTAGEHETSDWHSSWNAGVGFETALADQASFFVEARYLRIMPMSNRTQFVPIRVGFRF